MEEKSEKYIWPAKLEVGRAIENSSGDIETIYHIDNLAEGTYVLTSHFRFDENGWFESHRTYFLNEEGIRRTDNERKELSEVLNTLTKKELRQISKQLDDQLN